MRYDDTKIDKNEILEEDEGLVSQIIDLLGLTDTINSFVDELKLKYANAFFSTGLVNHEVRIKSYLNKNVI